MVIRAAPCNLLLPALSWVGGLIAAQYLSIPPLVLICLIAISITALFITKFNSKLLLLLVFLIALFRMQITQIRPANHLDKIMANHTSINTSLTGKITRHISSNYDTQLYLIKVQELDNAKVKGNIYLRTDDKFMPGNQITGFVSLEKLEGPRNPGMTDRRPFYKISNISGIGQNKGQMKLSPHTRPNIFFTLANALETRLRKRLGTAADYALAITLGKTAETSWDFRSSVRRAGLSHLFAVSGLHVGLVAMLFYGILILIFSRRPARVILLLLLIVYGFLCQWTPSVSRAILMLSLYSFSQFLERPVNLNQILLCSLLIITLIEPYQIFSAGLQLSFAATLIIINLAPHLEKMLFNSHLSKFTKPGRRLGQVLLLSAAVIVFIAPLSLANFGEFSGNGIITLLPASLIFSLLLPLAFTIMILPWGWQPFAACFKFFLFLFDKWLSVTANLPFYLQDFSLKFWQVFLIYFCLIQAIIAIRHYSKVKAIILFILIPVIFCVPAINITKSGLLKISCLDCGQGDLCLIEFPDGRNLLIDTGPPGKKSGNATDSLLPWLAERGISKLDQVIITHAHDDHYGGLLAIFEALDVKSIVTGRDFWHDLDDEEIYSAMIEENSLQITVCDTMSFYVDDIKLQFLHPDPLYVSNNQNNKSLVLKLTYHEFTALFTGDIETEAENWLLSHYPRFLDSDFLKVPHHGSISSSTEPFIKATSPTLCFIPAGKNNRFQFPHQKVVSRYQFLKDKLIIAAYDGAMLMQTDGYKINCQAMLRDSTIHLNCR